MPLYEYRCKQCGHTFEKIQSFSAPDAPCPRCGSEVERLLSAPAIQFKGSGFYLTDYGKAGGAPKGGSAGGEGSSSSAGSQSTAPAAGASSGESGSPAAAKPAPSAGSSSSTAGGSGGSGTGTASSS